MEMTGQCVDVSRTKVKIVMHCPVISIDGEQGVMDAGKLMEKHDIRHLAVTDKAGQIMGLISAKMISRNQIRVWQGRTLFD